MKLRVAGAQIPVTKNIEENQKTINRAIDFATAEKADVLLTPEGSLSGYTHEFDAQAVVSALNTVTGRAKSIGLGLALGTCFVEPKDNLCYDQIRFYDRKGTYLGFHSKILRAGTLNDPPQGEVNHYAERSLRTFELNDITVGGLICNDLWANPGCTPLPDPHLTQQLARLGARIILHAVNGGRDGSEFSKIVWQYHEANLRMRARAGKLYIISVDNCDPVDLPCSSPSGVIDPQGNWVIQTPPQREQYFVHTIKI